MLEFIFEANIAHYEELLTTETEPGKIATIRKLLAEEQAKQAEWRASDQRPDAAACCQSSQCRDEGRSA